MFLETTLRKRNYIHEEVWSRFDLENAYYYWVQRILYPQLFLKNTSDQNIQKYCIQLSSVCHVKESHRSREFREQGVEDILCYWFLYFCFYCLNISHAHLHCFSFRHGNFHVIFACDLVSLLYNHL